MKEPKIDRQREHQANERTFLAWMRTSIALIGFGFAIARFSLFLRQLQVALHTSTVSPPARFSSEDLGVALVVVGIVTISLAAWRYNQVFWQIERGDYRPRRWYVWITTTIVMALGILSIPLVLLRNKEIPPANPDLQPPANRVQY